MGTADAMPIQTVRETLHLLGWLNARYGRPDRAIGYFELMTVVDGLNATSWRTLATIQLSLEKNPEALASAAKALELGLPADEEALCHLVRAIAARRLGDIAESDKAAADYLKTRAGSGQGGGEA
jgi:tetratricopeptide (TPR) repeat protein